MTPFITLLDSKYEDIGGRELLELLDNYKSKGYTPEYFDCDDFAWTFKGAASNEGFNSVGFVIGKYYKTWHSWNIALVDDRFYQVEPQSRTYFIKRPEYKVVTIIL